MRNRNNIILSGVSAIMHSLIIPIFIYVFAIYYKPYGVYQTLSMPHASYTFNVTILFCIAIGSFTITRIWLYLIGRHKDVKKPVYAVWCLGEILMATMFMSLYTSLISRETTPFFEIAGYTFLMMSATCVYPYGFLWLGVELYAKNHEDSVPADENSLIRFYDEYNKMKLVIAPEAVIYIKSEENYVHIHYLDKGRPRKFTLRSSMRALEDTLSKHGMVRCHRSYFINPPFIRIVHRDSSGMIVAEINQDGYESIPISRKYQDSITRLL